MLKSALRLLILSVVYCGSALGQGTFGQIAYGGCWQTTFTLVNLSAASSATGVISFYGDDGSALTVPIQNAGRASSYQFTIAANGIINVVLSSTDANTTEGWASMSTTGTTVRGQGTIRCQNSGGSTFEAVVPMSIPVATQCILPLPPSPNPVIMIPFDNTADHLTAFAFANTANAALIASIEYDDQLGNPLVKGSMNLAALNHTAFYPTNDYPTLVGKKGTLRISASTAQLSVLALLFNSTGAFTTIMPVIP